MSTVLSDDTNSKAQINLSQRELQTTKASQSITQSASLNKANEGDLLKDRALVVTQEHVLNESTNAQNTTTVSAMNQIESTSNRSNRSTQSISSKERPTMEMTFEQATAKSDIQSIDAHIIQSSNQTLQPRNSTKPGVRSNRSGKTVDKTQLRSAPKKLAKSGRPVEVTKHFQIPEENDQQNVVTLIGTCTLNERSEPVSQWKLGKCGNDHRNVILDKGYTSNQKLWEQACTDAKKGLSKRNFEYTGEGDNTALTLDFLNSRILDYNLSIPMSEKGNLDFDTYRREFDKTHPWVEKFHGDIWKSMTTCHEQVSEHINVHTEINIYARGTEWILKSNFRLEKKNDAKLAENKNQKSRVRSTGTIGKGKGKTKKLDEWKNIARGKFKEFRKWKSESKIKSENDARNVKDPNIEDVWNTTVRTNPKALSKYKSVTNMEQGKTWTDTYDMEQGKTWTNTVSRSELIVKDTISKSVDTVDEVMRYDNKRNEQKCDNVRVMEKVRVMDKVRVMAEISGTVTLGPDNIPVAKWTVVNNRGNSEKIRDPNSEKMGTPDEIIWSTLVEGMDIESCSNTGRNERSEDNTEVARKFLFLKVYNTYLNYKQKNKNSVMVVTHDPSEKESMRRMKVFMQIGKNEKIQQLLDKVNKDLLECRNKAKANHTIHCDIIIRLVNGEWKSTATTNMTEHTIKMDVVEDEHCDKCAVDMGTANQLPTASNVPIGKDNVVISTSDEEKMVPLYDVQECMKNHCEANVGYAKCVIERHDVLNNSELFENSNNKSDNNLPKCTQNSRLREVCEECVTNQKSSPKGQDERHEDNTLNFATSSGLHGIEINGTKNGSVLVNKTSTKESKNDEMMVESSKDVESKEHVNDVERNGKSVANTMYGHKGLPKKLISKATNGYFNGDLSELKVGEAKDYDGYTLQTNHTNRNWNAAASHEGVTADQPEDTDQGRCSPEKSRLSALINTPLQDIYGGVKKIEVPTENGILCNTNVPQDILDSESVKKENKKKENNKEKRIVSTEKGISYQSNVSQVTSGSKSMEKEKEKKKNKKDPANQKEKAASEEFSLTGQKKRKNDIKERASIGSHITSCDVKSETPDVGKKGSDSQQYVRITSSDYTQDNSDHDQANTDQSRQTNYTSLCQRKSSDVDNGKKLYDVKENSEVGCNAQAYELLQRLSCTLFLVCERLSKTEASILHLHDEMKYLNSKLRDIAVLQKDIMASINTEGSGENQNVLLQRLESICAIHPEVLCHGNNTTESVLTMEQNGDSKYNTLPSTMDDGDTKYKPLLSKSDIAVTNEEANITIPLSLDTTNENVSRYEDDSFDKRSISSTIKQGVDHYNATTINPSGTSESQEAVDGQELLLQNSSNTDLGRCGSTNLRSNTLKFSPGPINVTDKKGEGQREESVLVNGKKAWNKGERPSECSVLDSEKRLEPLSLNLDDDLEVTKNGYYTATLDNPQLGPDTIQVSVQPTKIKQDIVQVSVHLTKNELQVDTHQDMVQVSFQIKNEIKSSQNANYVETPNVLSTSIKKKAASDELLYVQSNPSCNQNELFQVGDKPEQTLSKSMKMLYDAESVDSDLGTTDELLEVSIQKNEAKGFNIDERGFKTANHQWRKQGNDANIKLVSKMATNTANMPASKTETYQPLDNEARWKQMEKGGYMKEVGMKEKPPNRSCLQHMDNTSEVGNDCAMDNKRNSESKTIDVINLNQNMVDNGKVPQ